MHKKTRLGRAAVIGFGSQGRAHSIRLSESGVDVCVGLRSGSRRRSQTRKLGLKTTTPRRAVSGCDVVAILVPDQFGAETLADLAPHIDEGTLIVFAAGYPLVFGSVSVPPSLDITMVAPHGPGIELEAGTRMSGFVGIHQDDTGHALSRARAYARAIGLSPLVETTPMQEAHGDLFGEQTLLCGGLVGLTAAVMRTMINRGISPRNAHFETVAQLRQLADLLDTGGLDGFWREISDCAAAGSAGAAPQLFDADFESKLSNIFDDIESGRFARRFQKRGKPARWPARWDVLLKAARAAETGQKKGGS
jgi:ketol-acid reductoisomerase